MSKEKQARRKAAGPAMDPTAMSMQMGPMPGMPQGPGNIMNNGMNPLSYGPQTATMREDGMNMHPYGDSGDRYPQLGADILNPVQVPHSTLNQNTPLAGRGLNKQVPYGMQMQPPADQMDVMESGRLAGEAQKRMLMPSAMGLTGMPAVPGAMDPQMGGHGNHLPLSPMNSMNPMTPGADKQVNKPSKGKK